MFRKSSQLNVFLSKDNIQIKYLIKIFKSVYLRYLPPNSIFILFLPCLIINDNFAPLNVLQYECVCQIIISNGLSTNTNTICVHFRFEYC